MSKRYEVKKEVNHNSSGAYNSETRQPIASPDFFVSLNEPVLFRRNLLEASKGTLVVIKGLYLIYEIKERKQEKLLQLQKEVREIRLLLQKAEEFMPKYSRQDTNLRLPNNSEKKSTEKGEKKPTVQHIQKEESTTQKKLSDIDRLSQSITDIDDKLKALPDKNTKKEGHTQKPVAAETKKTPSEELTGQLGKTLEGIQKRLKQL